MSVISSNVVVLVCFTLHHLFYLLGLQASDNGLQHFTHASSFNTLFFPLYFIDVHNGLGPQAEPLTWGLTT